ncbi:MULTISPECIES: glycosyltransferase [Chryseobacterium]|uniref:Glycosyltransferase involved in cell wall biosynthesis n=1 Tax=Chryseobacterium geocarposphaerae TaxID=1416776 RepID=A0ABU1LGA9_9FLAO|nr:MULTISPECIES: glycosyltransferase [Chryseobacterium]MDR6405764.1 glycosyltransferase involved in cell wall biosynthesis [Chryseobacterium geocarposphaerae]MDR6699073.1 glycosyltransferase involved in cell wall biosynthesis [Chryseobacterium ginsenosidimutans]
MQLSVNYHGFFDGNFGISEATRLNALALEKVGINVNRINYSSETFEKVENNSSSKIETSINIFHININFINDFFSKNQDLDLKNHYNIIYWAWEFPEVSDKVVEILNVFDELWVPSDFCVNIFTKYTGIPVIRFSHPIQKLEDSKDFDKTQYNIPQDSKIYLTIFDSLSTTIRKNPEATLEAFTTVFKDDKESVLVVKTHNLERSKDAQKALEKYNNIPNIIIINEHFSKEKLHSLIQQSDVLISLHGSEGFGLTMAEAMAYGKIVMGTGYSGNLEFMNVNNSFLVQYDFIKTSNTKGLIDEGLTLAKPRLQDAVAKLLYIKNNFNALDHFRENAKLQIENNFSLESIGELFKIRLGFINNFDKEDKGSNDVNNVFYLSEIEKLNKRINYLERTVYNKIRNKVNDFLKKIKGRK